MPAYLHKLDCYTVLANCKLVIIGLSVMCEIWLVFSTITSTNPNIDRGDFLPALNYEMPTMHYGLMWLMNSQCFLMPLTPPLQSPNGCARRLWKSLLIDLVSAGIPMALHLLLPSPATRGPRGHQGHCQCGAPASLPETLMKTWYLLDRICNSWCDEIYYKLCM